MQNVLNEQVAWQKIPNLGEEYISGFSNQDTQLFRSIRDTLRLHGALNIFGIFLVHRHFTIDENEKMVEYVDAEKATISIQPVDAGEIDESQLVPTNWVFDAESTELKTYVLQWGFAQDLKNTELKPLSHKYSKCLGSIRDILRDYNSTSRFGMSLIRNQFQLGLDENLLETTDLQNRTLNIRKITAAEEIESTITTNWEFSDDDQISRGRCVCARNSSGHLYYHRSS